jgi:SAM-dependent methyltransferase
VSPLPDPTERFSDRAADYALYRPDYPPAAVSAILEDLVGAAQLTAADVGAGTGIASRLLAERGVRVLAVEPNAAMREAAAPHPRVEYRVGTAEATGLAAASVDLVLCAQAFHWFDAQRALAEFRRILRPGGRLAILWNERREDDAFTGAYSRLVAEMAPDRTEASREGLLADLLRGGFRDVQCLEFDHEQRLTADGLAGRALSASYMPRQGPQSEDLRRRLRALHDQYADGSGAVKLLYRTVLWRARSREASRIHVAERHEGPRPVKEET